MVHLKNTDIFAVGHGNSGGDRVHITNYQTYVRDLMQHLEMLKSSHSDLLLFVIGESMVCAGMLLHHDNMCTCSGRVDYHFDSGGKTTTHHWYGFISTSYTG